MATLNSSYQKVGESYCGNGGGTNVYIRLYAKLNSQSIANNNSSINLQTRVYFSGALRTSAVKCTTDGTTITVNSGSVSYSKGNEYTLQTVTRTISHGSSGASGNITKGCSWSSYYSSVNGSTSGTFTLPTIPRYSVISSADNFTDEGDPTIKFTNPSNGYFALKAKIEAGGNTQFITRTPSAKATSYTFQLTNAERIKLRNLASNSNSLTVRFTICAMNGNSELSASYLDRTMTITNANPTFNNFTYKDTNTVVTDLIGNDQILVKGLSTLQVTISSNNKMVATKQATAKNYVATIDNTNISQDYSESDIVFDMNTLASAGTKKLNIRAYDSRNNSTLVYKDVVVYDYNKPVLNVTATRLNNFEDTTTLTVNGTFSSLLIDGVEKNTLNKVEYRYRQDNGEWGSWTELITTCTDNTFQCTDIILKLENTSTFDFEVRATDNLTSTTKSVSVDIGKSIFFISSNKKACYINGQEILSYEVVDEW